MPLPPHDRPLLGQTVLNLRAVEDAPALTQALVELGATVIERPAIAFAPPSDDGAGIRSLIDAFQPLDWIVFTSATALRWTLRHMAELTLDASFLCTARIAAIGQGTARALAEAGLPVHTVPQENFQAEGLRDALLKALEPGESLWLPRAEQGREVLVRDLVAAGHPVWVTPVYQTVAAPGGLGPVAEDLEGGRIDWIVFTSSAIVSHFLGALSSAGRNAVARAKIACLGRITAKAAEAGGLSVTVVPQQQDLPGLIHAIAQAAAFSRAGKS